MPQEWIAVYITYNPPEAYIVAGRLKHEGIPCWVNEPIGHGALGIRIGSLGEVSVLVRPEDYAQAQAILNDPDTDQLPDSTRDVTYYWHDDDDEFDDDEFDDDDDE